ncbi:hypothetical protein B0J13DRAFT_548006 [Dactylonectria estremocensis]|uniref:Uncharacterized protein n=1 Tax=Dactylonectria estremocensis TaxID=1079267 RepID=A0A9P9JAB6_9HYPO|nr:hypothetical protein B0J13DRAFT_548006 [Dactylonectria estremocensis]
MERRAASSTVRGVACVAAKVAGGVYGGVPAVVVQHSDPQVFDGRRLYSSLPTAHGPQPTAHSSRATRLSIVGPSYRDNGGKSSIAGNPAWGLVCLCARGGTGPNKPRNRKPDTTADHVLLEEAGEADAVSVALGAGRRLRLPRWAARERGNEGTKALSAEATCPDSNIRSGATQRLVVFSAAGTVHLFLLPLPARRRVARAVTL